VYFARGGERDVAPQTPPPARSTPIARPIAASHATQLKMALHDLQQGATCADRKRAIAKLVALRDSNAVPAIKKARGQLSSNACLRTAADQAVKTLERPH